MGDSMTIERGEEAWTKEFGCVGGIAGMGGCEDVGRLEERESVEGFIEAEEDEKRSKPKADKRPSSGNLGLVESRLSSSPVCSFLTPSTCSTLLASFPAFRSEWADSRGSFRIVPAVLESPGVVVARLTCSPVSSVILEPGKVCEVAGDMAGTPSEVAGALVRSAVLANGDVSG